MPNHSDLRRPIASWLLAASAGAMLSGCVAAVVPIAAGGMLGRKVLIGGHVTPATTKAPPAAAQASPTPVPVAAPPKAVRARSPVPEPVAPPAPTPPPRLAEPVVPAEAPAVAATTNWDAVARAMAKMAARTPDPRKVDVLQGTADAAPVLCGARHTAVAIDTATLGTGDGLYVGALYTMGLEIVLMSPSRTLPPSEIKALAKQGIATPVLGKTLFLNAPGSEDAARAAIARQYCVVGLVGDRAADFPGHVLPGTPKAREGWFLIPRH